MGQHKNGGFTSGTPWISVNKNFREINTEDREKPDSVFQYYRKLIELRKQLPVLSRGRFEALLRDDARILAYRRVLEENGKTEIYVVCNFFREEAELPAGLIPEGARLLLGNYEADTKSLRKRNCRLAGRAFAQLRQEKGSGPMSALSRWLRGREDRQGIGGDPDCLIVKPWHSGYNNTESYGMAAKAFDRQKYGKLEEKAAAPV